MTEPRAGWRGFAPAGPVIVGLLIVMLNAAGSYAALLATAPGTPVPSGSPAPTSTTGFATPSATAPAVTPTPVPLVTPHVWDSADLESLMRVAPSALAGSCTILQPTTSDPLRSADAIAAIACQPPGGTDRVIYERLPDGPMTESAYAMRVSQAGVVMGSGGCWDGTAGEVDYSYGRALCWNDTGLTRVTWTDERENVIGSASGSKGDLRARVAWWWNIAFLSPVSTGAGLTVDQQYLMDQVQPFVRSSCLAYDARTDPAKPHDPYGDLGAIDCFPPGDPLVADVGWFRFTTPAALHGWYDYRVALAGVSKGVGGCYDGTPGETTWTSGRIACLRLSGGVAAIRWTNDDTLTYGALNAKTSDLPSLFSWWQNNGSP